jgi:hypothetical protein
LTVYLFPATTTRVSLAVFNRKLDPAAALVRRRTAALFQFRLCRGGQNRIGGGVGNIFSLRSFAHPGLIIAHPVGFHHPGRMRRRLFAHPVCGPEFLPSLYLIGGDG